MGSSQRSAVLEGGLRGLLSGWLVMDGQGSGSRRGGHCGYPQLPVLQLFI